MPGSMCLSPQESSLPRLRRGNGDSERGKAWPTITPPGAGPPLSLAVTCYFMALGGTHMGTQVVTGPLLQQLSGGSGPAGTDADEETYRGRPPALCVRPNFPGLRPTAHKALHTIVISCQH